MTKKDMTKKSLTKKVSSIFLTAALGIAGLLSGCGNAGKAEDNSADLVASAGETAEPVDIVEEGMVPVYGESVKDGVYSVTVDSSSSMFQIVSCELTVKNGQMTAVMTMGGTGYLYVYMGTGEEAVKAASEEYIPFEETENGEHTFTVPVEALDQSISCAAFSKNKEKWYDRELVFRMDSLPSDALADGSFPTVESLGLEDGTYQVEVTLAEGGSGRAAIESPARFTVTDQKAQVTLVWMSSHYDYMVVEGEKYLPVITDEKSVFEIPLTGFDRGVTVMADTTAMSTPHEIEYKLIFDSATIEKVEE